MSSSSDDVRSTKSKVGTSYELLIFETLLMSMMIVLIHLFVPFFTKQPEIIGNIHAIYVPKDTENLNFIKENIGPVIWLKNDINMQNLILKSNSNKCNLCKYPENDETTNSTKNDLIMGLLYGSTPHNVLTLVRSIRTVGCKASIVLLTCEQTYRAFNQNYLKELEKCGVIILHIPSINQRTRQIHGNLLRHLFFAEFLEKYGSIFDRVVILDVFDSYFQKDPFTDDFNQEKVIFSYENTTFRQNDVNNGWVKLLDANYSTEKYLTNYPLCSGLFYGTAKNLIKFYSIYVNLTHWMWVGTKAQDQGTLNAMFYNNKFGDLVEIDFNRKIVSATGHVFYGHKMLVSKFKELNELVRYNDGIVPSVIHQYDRTMPGSEFIKHHCPILGVWQRSPYARYDYRVFNFN